VGEGDAAIVLVGTTVWGKAVVDADSVGVLTSVTLLGLPSLDGAGVLLACALHPASIINPITLLANVATTL